MATREFFGHSVADARGLNKSMKRKQAADDSSKPQPRKFNFDVQKLNSLMEQRTQAQAVHRDLRERYHEARNTWQESKSHLERSKRSGLTIQPNGSLEQQVEHDYQEMQRLQEAFEDRAPALTHITELANRLEAWAREEQGWRGELLPGKKVPFAEEGSRSSFRSIFRKGDS